MSTDEIGRVQDLRTITVTVDISDGRVPIVLDTAGLSGPFVASVLYRAMQAIDGELGTVTIHNNGEFVGQVFVAQTVDDDGDD